MLHFSICRYNFHILRSHLGHHAHEDLNVARVPIFSFFMFSQYVGLSASTTDQDPLFIISKI